MNVKPTIEFFINNVKAKNSADVVLSENLG